MTVLNPVFFFEGTRQRMRFDQRGIQTVNTTYLFVNSNPNTFYHPIGMVVLPLGIVGAVVDEVNRRHQISERRCSSVQWEDVRLALGLSIIKFSAILTSAENADYARQMVVIFVDFTLSRQSYEQVLFHQDWPFDMLISTADMTELTS